jgi:hypothetical protein
MTFNMPKEKQFKEAVKLLKKMTRKVDNKELPNFVAKLIDDPNQKVNGHSKLQKIFSTIEKEGKELGLDAQPLKKSKFNEDLDNMPDSKAAKQQSDIVFPRRKNKSRDDTISRDNDTVMEE